MDYSITAMMRWIDMTMTLQICTDGVYFYAWLCIARCFSMTICNNWTTLSKGYALDVTIVVIPLGYVLQAVRNGICWCQPDA